MESNATYVIFDLGEEFEEFYVYSIYPHGEFDVNQIERYMEEYLQDNDCEQVLDWILDGLGEQGLFDWDSVDTVPYNDYDDTIDELTKKYSHSIFIYWSPVFY